MLFTKPVFHKTPTDGCEHHIQGKRPTMEDESVIAQLGDDLWLYMVLDGHGGKSASAYFAENIPIVFLRKLDQLKQDFEDFELNQDYDNLDTITKIATNTFLELDEKWFNNITDEVRGHGTTVTAILMTENNIYTINVGDSRVVLYHNNEVVGATVDHKPDPDDRIEARRILEASENLYDRYRIGHMEFAGPLRVIFGGFGKLKRSGVAMTRALGDYVFKLKKIEVPETGWRGTFGYTKHERVYAGKESALSPVPDVNIYNKDDVSWILLACDGLFDVIRNEVVLDIKNQRWDLI